MTMFGYTLLGEEHGPRELVSIAQQAEEVEFDFLTASDHYHPWVPEQRHSPYAWSVLGAVAMVTERVELATMVTCPTIRYHPAIVAQKAATIGVMSRGRFTLGVGAGEQLNEHVIGEGWPPVHERHEMFEEAIEVIRPDRRRPGGVPAVLATRAPAAADRAGIRCLDPAARKDYRPPPREAKSRRRLITSYRYQIPR